ncbi:unnamed protein product [Auanema sp. JU1783]|nr:unnamed protein product [Auanema sp. JU1783]
MINPRFCKNSLLYLGLCAFLLFLNNYFVVYEEVQEKDYLKIAKNCRDPIAYSNESLFELTRCSVDNSLFLSCVKSSGDVFFPFSFIKKRFDLTGRVGKDDVFEWVTSYAKLKLPEGVYDPQGSFGHFSTYNVENRDRVKCISGDTGVPMSIQWSSTPYYYPIQIAQYGLQHYSRFKTANTSSKSVVVGEQSKEWNGSPGETDSSERIFYQDPDKGAIVNITSPGSLKSPGCYLYLNEDPELHFINFEWLPYSNSSFTILVKILRTNSVLLLNYVEGSDSRCIWLESEDKIEDQLSFNIALGTLESKWYVITRDVLADVNRALSSIYGNKKKKDENMTTLHASEIKIVTIGFRGYCCVKQAIEQSSSASEDSFLKAAEWFSENQDSTGGWPVPVERSIAEKRLVLPAGWHSAMAQGHGLSLLSRAFIYTGDRKYLDASIRALDLFEKPASDGGVLNLFFNHSWYEEYPTSPGTFVLNGFMYSLIGLYDMSSLKKDFDNTTVASGVGKAKHLFQKGFESLRELLPLFDTGSGSIYDLRHVGLKTVPNLARWDYHAVHIYLLKWLVKITGDQFLDSVADRWIGYTHGKRAKHN